MVSSLFVLRATCLVFGDRGIRLNCSGATGDVNFCIVEAANASPVLSAEPGRGDWIVRHFPEGAEQVGVLAEPGVPVPPQIIIQGKRLLEHIQPWTS